jgi:hypothetical protein
MTRLLKYGAFVLVAVILTACCTWGTCCYAPSGALVGWDGLGSPPNDGAQATKPKRQPKTEAASATPDDITSSPGIKDIKLHSKEWWAKKEADDQAADAVLTKKLKICRGCSPPSATDEDRTGSAPR